MKKKVILITGASSGIGFKCAYDLILKGHIVYCTSRNVDNMKVLKDMGGYIYYLDVTKQDSIDKVVKEIINKHNKIDILFSNAGYVLEGPIEIVDIEDVKKLFDTNVYGLARCLKSVLPYMRSRKKGKILVTTSAASLISMPGMSWYPATKHALDALVNGLRSELKEFNIKVSIIQPNFINTNIIYPAIETQKKIPNEIDPIYLKQQKNLKYNFTKNTLNGNDPKVISDLVMEAVNDNNPKAYYRECKTTIINLIKPLIPQKIMDKINSKLTIN